MEDEAGVPGGPIDETEFEFEPEPSEGPSQLVLDGVLPVPDWVPDSLAPYLDARRARVAGIGGAGSPLLVLTRLDETTQAFTVRAPLAERRQATRSREPVVQASFVPGDPEAVLYRSDVGGNEDYQLFRTSPGAPPRLLTDGQSRHGGFAWSGRGDAIAFTANLRDGANMDIYAADGISADSSRVLSEREGSWSVSSWSPEGQHVLARHYISFLESMIYLVDVASGSVAALVEPIAGVAHEHARLLPGGRRAFVTGNRDGDFIDLYDVDLESREARDLTADIPWDVEAISLSPNGRQLAFATNEDGWSVVRLLDTRSGAVQHLDKIPRGVVSTLRFAARVNRLALTLETSTRPADAYVYDLDTTEVVRWTESEVGGLDADEFVTPELIRYSSFDGVRIPGWLYRPRGEGPFPVLVWVHGGPEEQSRPGFSPIIQYFVNELGAAVIAPNVRGSDGYGRGYLSLDDGNRREDAIKDIGALLDFIETHEALDASRVGIHGGSYGGYVVLASLVHYGNRFRAGCDVVGISNFVTFLENTREYRVDQRRAEYGDERDPSMRQFLTQASPLGRASEIDSALLVVHGANDPRVPALEAEQMVAAVREAGGEAGLLLAMDEGHGYRKRRNRDAFYAHMVAFFARHLGIGPSSESGGADEALPPVEGSEGN